MKVDEWFVDQFTLVVCSSLKWHQRGNINSSNWDATSSWVGILSRPSSKEVLRLTTIVSLILVWKSKRNANSGWQFAINASSSSSCRWQLNAKQLGDVSNDSLKKEIFRYEFLTDLWSLHFHCLRSCSCLYWWCRQHQQSQFQSQLHQQCIHTQGNQSTTWCHNSHLRMCQLS